MQKKYLSIKFIVLFSILFILMFASVAYYQYLEIEHVKGEEQKQDIARNAYSKKMRENGRLLAEQMKLHPIKLQDDPFAEPEPSDKEELAQAKLWHQTPPTQRVKIFPDKPL